MGEAVFFILILIIPIIVLVLSISLILDTTTQNITKVISIVAAMFVSIIIYQATISFIDSNNNNSFEEEYRKEVLADSLLVNETTKCTISINCICQHNTGGE